MSQNQVTVAWLSSSPTKSWAHGDITLTEIPTHITDLDCIKMTSPWDINIEWWPYSTNFPVSAGRLYPLRFPVIPNFSLLPSRWNCSLQRLDLNVEKIWFGSILLSYHHLKDLLRPPVQTHTCCILLHVISIGHAHLGTKTVWMGGYNEQRRNGWVQGKQQQKE